MLSTVDTWKNVTNGERVVRGKIKFLLYFIVKRKPYLPVLQKNLLKYSLPENLFPFWGVSEQLFSNGFLGVHPW